MFQDSPLPPTCLYLPRHSLSTGASREAPVDKRAHQDCNKTHAVSTDTNRKFMQTLFGVHAQVSFYAVRYCFFVTCEGTGQILSFPVSQCLSFSVCVEKKGVKQNIFLVSPLFPPGPIYPIVLHFITLHYISLQFITFHYISFYFIITHYFPFL